MAKKKETTGREFFPAFEPAKHTFSETGADAVKYYPKSGNCYNKDGKYIGKGILNGGVLEIIYKDKK